MVKTNPIVEEIGRKEEIKKLLHLFTIQGPSMIYGVGGARKPMLAALAARKSKGPVLIVVPSNDDILKWEEDLRFFAPETAITTLPLVDIAGFDVTFGSMERIRYRMHTLSELMNGNHVFVLATGVEASQLLPSCRKLKESAFHVHNDDVIRRETILAWLTENGYERTDQVERCGHFSVRGDIIDVFAVNEEHPVRIEFWGDEVDNIRLFDEETQQSVRSADEAEFLPFRMENAEETTVLSYLDKGILIYDEPARIEEKLNNFLHEEKENRKHYLAWTELAEAGARSRQVVFSELHQNVPAVKIRRQETWAGQSVTNYQRQVPLFLADLSYWLKKKQKVIIVCDKKSDRESIEGAVRENGIPICGSPTEGAVCLSDGMMTGGFELPDENLIVVTGGDIFGRKKLRRYRNASKGHQIRYFSDLRNGDYVVQQVHGIGRYMGLKTIEIEGVHRDYLTIQYAGNDRLYLPMEQITTLEKYIGPEGQAPALHKMGGVQWERARSKARKSIYDLAEKLVQIYARREMSPGYAFPKDTPEQREFEDTFPYDETPDQLTAAEQIREAMGKPHPMDMLLCGDVGFGKTEVAMRAVFQCVMGGRQAAVLVPTTVLSQQHYATFGSRMKPFGINIAVLNRFCSAPEKKKILREISDGSLDIIIGTHALLSKKIKFRELGLLVVDEEQRFGVMQKEKWKSMSEGIDVLTLSATPIPRTLNMCLSGVRDMAVINTPPADRHAIQTYVAEYDDAIVRDSILREKERGGQVYFVYNRIESIDAMADHLRKMLPDTVSIGIAYGKMDGNTLERVMYNFYKGKYDVLVCTTLIENGLDQPNANTMLVYDADHLGLSQIYQMRGRVGRSSRIARAYFFYRRGKALSEVAEKRLAAIREFTELGSGFKIALRDLEIRGAGNLLGAEQHGNIAGIGFSTYCAMLDEAIGELKAKRENKPAPVKLPETVIEMNRDAYIDSGYIESEEQKIEMYHRLAMVQDEASLSDLLDEAIDRFGTPSPPAERLFAVARLRVKAKHLGIGSIAEGREYILITWARPELMRNWKIDTLPKEMMRKLRFLPSQPMRVRIDKAVVSADPAEWIESLLDAIRRGIPKGENCE